LVLTESTTIGFKWGKTWGGGAKKPTAQERVSVSRTNLGLQAGRKGVFCYKRGSWTASREKEYGERNCDEMSSGKLIKTKGEH